MRINKIYVISLGIYSKPELQEAIEAKLGGMDFFANTGYEIIEAFDGRDGAIEDGYSVYQNWDLGAGTWNDWWQRPVLGGEIGCAISHRKIWERIVFDGHGLSLVLEEDFMMSEGGSIAALQDPPVNSNWDIALLGRDKIEKDVEEATIDNVWCRPRHFYNLHAYVIKNSDVAKRLLSGGLKENVIPVDEYVSALGYAHRREDVRTMFPPSMTIIATQDPDFVIQKREGTPFRESSIEPNDGSSPNDTVDIPADANGMPPSPDDIPTNENYYEILDVSDWEAWKEKYVNMSVAKGEYDLMVSDRGDNVFEFPLFTPKFCKEAIALAESKDNWTIDRHEFYPTNDVLLQDIGLDKIYNRVLDEVVRPLAIHLWNLEGESWHGFSNENFMARYTTNRQSHLSLHHDRSHLTMVIKLNDEFSGGGTWFPQYQKLSNPEELGTAVLHPGMITHRHGARPITLGKRYIIVSFIRSHLEP